eukprot:NODE_1997_length_1230_cov_6.036410_g1658_i0.p1 GENE.NODE_1997_length_1230_cov_6.036410_g1658_i0~~NODE_1997_length_1230_cov_6.036410_g1658_i0.p1  ORF type:complete len:149 (+),score=36.00 NODE_1997_length_1230_cov_6.036410_g1658_i0:412-858(+)
MAMLQMERVLRKGGCPQYECTRPGQYFASNRSRELFTDADVRQCKMWETYVCAALEFQRALPGLARAPQGGLKVVPAPSQEEAYRNFRMWMAAMLHLLAYQSPVGRKFTEHSLPSFHRGRAYEDGGFSRTPLPTCPRCRHEEALIIEC